MKEGIFAAGGGQFEQWLPGLWGSVPHFELLLILPPLPSLGSTVDTASMAVPSGAHQKTIAESGVWWVTDSAVVLDIWIIPPEVLGWPSGPPTYIIPLAEEGKEAERDVQAAHRRQ